MIPPVTCTLYLHAQSLNVFVPDYPSCSVFLPYVPLLCWKWIKNLRLKSWVDFVSLHAVGVDLFFFYIISGDTLASSEGWRRWAAEVAWAVPAGDESLYAEPVLCVTAVWRSSGTNSTVTRHCSHASADILILKLSVVLWVYLLLTGWKK